MDKQNKTALNFRSALLIAFLFFISIISAAAQIQGVSASVMSVGNGGKGTFRFTGVPASGPPFRAQGYRSASCGRVFGRGVPTYGHHQVDHDHFHQRVIPIVYVYAYPYLLPPSYSLVDSSHSQQQEPSNPYQSGYEQGRLEGEIQRLQQEIAALKESQQQEATPPEAIVQPNEPATDSEAAQSQELPQEPFAVIVLRDGHTVELRNYIIAESTIWNQTPDKTERIPISDVDLEATRKLNETRGGDFSTAGSQQ